MSKKFLKLFGLTMAVVLVAGAAWALLAASFTTANQATITITGGSTDTADYAFDRNAKANSAFSVATSGNAVAKKHADYLWAPWYYTLNGDGKFSGALWQKHPSFGGGAAGAAPAASGREPYLPLALHLQAGESQTLTLAPRGEGDVPRGIYNKAYIGDTKVGANTDLFLGDLFSLVASGAGKVVLQAAYNNAPSDFYSSTNVDWTAADDNTYGTGYRENTYLGGLYVEKGTVALTHGNAAGYGPVMVAAGATLAVEGTQNVILGNQSPNRYALPMQPVALGYYVTGVIKNITDPWADAFGSAVWSPIPAMFANLKAATPVGSGKVAVATINVADIAGSEQTMDLYSGIRQMAYSSGFASAAGVALDTNTDGTPRMFGPGFTDTNTGTVAKGANAVGNYFVYDPDVDSDGFRVTGSLKRRGKAGEMLAYADGTLSAMQLLKTGKGLLHSHAPDTEQQIAIWNNTYRGGTEVREGTYFADGATSGAAKDRFKGSMGDTWTKWTLDTGNGRYQKATPDATKPSRWVGTATAYGNLVDKAPRNNSLKIGNDDGTYASAVVNRDQFFSSFNTELGTLFTAWKYADPDMPTRNRLPQVTVWLDGSNSNVYGKMGGQALTGSFRAAEMAFVLESRHSAATYLNFPPRAVGINNPAQAMLTLHDHNEVVGNTLIVNGVLAAIYGDSIPYAGTPEGQLIKDGRLVVATEKFLTVDDREFSTYPLNDGFGVIGNNWGQESDRAVYLLKRDAVVSNPTTVNDYGSLAAEAGTTVHYENVIFNGYNPTLSTETQLVNAAGLQYDGNMNIVINPRAVIEAPAIENLGNVLTPVYENMLTANEPPVWGEHFPYTAYPAWTGTIAVGVGDATYDFGGNGQAPTNIMVSRGTFHLEGYPETAGTFAHVTVRESSTLSFGQDTNDFGSRMSLTVEDNSRLQMVVRPDDVKTSREDAYLQSNPAVLSVGMTNFFPLGITPAHNQRRLVLLVDLKTALAASGQEFLPAGSWVKLFHAGDVTYGWNALHYSGDGTDRDLKKVRIGLPGYVDKYLDDSQVYVDIDETTHSIYINALVDIYPEPDVEGVYDANLATADSGNVVEAAANANVELFFDIGTDYIPANLEIRGAPAGWVYDVVTGEDGRASVTGTMPADGSSVSFTIQGLNVQSNKWSFSKTFTVKGTSTPGPVVEEDGAMFSKSSEERTDWAEGDEYVRYFTLDSKYDPASVTLEGPTWLSVEQIVGNLDGYTHVVKGTIPVYVAASTRAIQTGSFSYRIHAKLLDAAATEFKSPSQSFNYTYDDGTNPNRGGSSSGCDAGFAGLALLLAAPLFLRKKD